MTPGEKVNVTISTQSQVYKEWPQTGPVPQIAMNGKPFPAPSQKPMSGSGVQIAVIKSVSDITNPASILTNQYIALPNRDGSWMTLYQYMWLNVMRQIFVAGDIDEELFFLVTYGMDANAPPPPNVLGELLRWGAGSQLQGWDKSVDIGSQSGYWVGFPANYILVGGSSYRYGEGTEAYGRAAPNSPVTTSLQVTLTNPM